eukprot:195914-Chlamydomonas_euryale.AAC.1
MAAARPSLTICRVQVRGGARARLKGGWSGVVETTCKAQAYVGGGESGGGRALRLSRRASRLAAFELLVVVNEVGKGAGVGDSHPRSSRFWFRVPRSGLGFRVLVKQPGPGSDLGSRFWFKQPGPGSG